MPSPLAEAPARDRLREVSPGTLPPTPVLTFALTIAGVARRLHLKAEWFSPLGSSKGRTAAALLASVADRVDPLAGVIESTSGNLGTALSMLCLAKAIPFTAVVDPRTSRDLVRRMRSLGAVVIEVTTEDDGDGYLLHRLRRVRQELQRDPRLVWTDQYHNPANPGAHETGTGPELAAAVPGLQAVFVPVSTGGTLAGLRAFARKVDAGWRCVGVDVVGSTALGGSPGRRLLTGIGASLRSSFVTDADVDVEYVTAGETVGACDWADACLGVGLGGSTGAAITAAVRRMHAEPELTEVCCLCPDAATAYADTLFSRTWRDAHDVVPVPPDAEVVRAAVT